MASPQRDSMEVADGVVPSQATNGWTPP